MLARFIDLQKRFRLTDKIIVSVNKILNKLKKAANVDFTSIDKLINQQIAISKQFLKSVLQS